MFDGLNTTINLFDQFLKGSKLLEEVWLEPKGLSRLLFTIAVSLFQLLRYINSEGLPSVLLGGIA